MEKIDYIKSLTRISNAYEEKANSLLKESGGNRLVDTVVTTLMCNANIIMDEVILLQDELIKESKK